LGQYIVPADQQMLELPNDAMVSTMFDPAQTHEIDTTSMLSFYGGVPGPESSDAPLITYADWFKVEGVASAVLFALMLASFWFPDRNRAAAGLFGWVTVAMVVTPVAVLSYGARYATPAYGPLACGAALGLDAVITRAGLLRRRRAVADRSPGRWTALRLVRPRSGVEV
jgi:hypothetical protein